MRPRTLRFVGEPRPASAVPVTSVRGDDETSIRGRATEFIDGIDDLDREVLAELIGRSVAHIDEVYDAAGGVLRMSEMPPHVG